MHVAREKVEIEKENKWKNTDSKRRKKCKKQNKTKEYMVEIQT